MRRSSSGWPRSKRRSGFPVCVRTRLGIRLAPCKIAGAGHRKSPPSSFAAERAGGWGGRRRGCRSATMQSASACRARRSWPPAFDCASRRGSDHRTMPTLPADCRRRAQTKSPAAGHVQGSGAPGLAALYSDDPSSSCTRPVPTSRFSSRAGLARLAKLERTVTTWSFLMSRPSSPAGGALSPAYGLAGDRGLLSSGSAAADISG